MTVPGFIMINLLVGATVAFGARVQIRTLQRPVFYNRYFGALMLLELPLLVPAGIYFNGFYPDWSWMYLLDTRWLPMGINIMVVATYPIAGVMGYLVGYFSARSKSNWVTLMFMVFLVLGIIGFFAVGGDQFGSLGTYEQYHRNVGLEKLWNTSLLPSIVLTWCGVGICWVYMVYRFAKEGRLASPNHN